VVPSIPRLRIWTLLTSARTLVFFVAVLAAMAIPACHSRDGSSCRPSGKLPEVRITVYPQPESDATSTVSIRVGQELTFSAEFQASSSDPAVSDDIRTICLRTSTTSGRTRTTTLVGIRPGTATVTSYGGLGHLAALTANLSVVVR